MSLNKIIRRKRRRSVRCSMDLNKLDLQRLVELAKSKDITFKQEYLQKPYEKSIIEQLRELTIHGVSLKGLPEEAALDGGRGFIAIDYDGETSWFREEPSYCCINDYYYGNSGDPGICLGGANVLGSKLYSVEEIIRDYFIR